MSAGPFGRISCATNRARKPAKDESDNAGDNYIPNMLPALLLIGHARIIAGAREMRE